MYKIQTLNKIDPEGLKIFPLDKYEIASEFSSPDAIIVRSQAMHDMQLPASLLAIARAGAGVNNIPIEKCTEKGIVVYNTPGANAHAVKEIVILVSAGTCRAFCFGATDDTFVCAAAMFVPITRKRITERK